MRVSTGGVSSDASLTRSTTRCIRSGKHATTLVESAVTGLVSQANVTSRHMRAHASGCRVTCLTAYLAVKDVHLSRFCSKCKIIVGSSSGREMCVNACSRRRINTDCHPMLEISAWFDSRWKSNVELSSGREMSVNACPRRRINTDCRPMLEISAWLGSRWKSNVEFSHV